MGEAIEASGINDPLTATIDPEEQFDICEITIDGEGIDYTCDFSDGGMVLDMDQCTSLGGRKLTFGYEMDCDGLSMDVKNMPYCVHESCGASEVEDEMNKALDGEPAMDGSLDCDLTVDINESTPAFDNINGASALSSMHVLPVAL